MWTYNHTDELCHWGIKGMKWGVRRFQNKDGSLTPQGKKRYADDNAHDDYKKAHERKNVRDMSNDELNAKNQRLEAERKYNAMQPKTVSGAEKAKNVVDSASNLVKAAKSIEQSTRPAKQKVKMDLSSMSDSDLRNAINREMLERQYNDMFSAPETMSKGRERVKMVLETAGDVLAVGGAALGIALSIKGLKG